MAITKMRTKPAAQRRSREKKERILAAMDALLRNKSFSKISINDIARKSRVSPATIYQRFQNRDAAASILLELYFRRVEEWARRPRERSVSSRNTAIYEALVSIGRDAWDQIEALGHIMRPAYLYSRLRPDLVGPEWARLQRLALEGFRNFLEQYRDVIDRDDLQEAAGVLAYFFNFMILGKLLHSDDASSLCLSHRDGFARELATFAHGYLIRSQKH
jgi:AcrR family transcriptional regulator